MNRTTLRWYALPILFFVLTTSGTTPSIAQESSDRDKQVVTNEQWQQGYNGLAAILRKKKVQLVQDYESWKNLDLSTTFLIALGDVRAVNTFLEPYLQAGGRVLLASDQNFESVSLDGFRVRIDGSSDVTTRFRSSAYLSMPDCPRIDWFVAKDHPLFRGIRGINTNRPALIRLAGNRRPRDWEILANFPRLRNAFSNPFLLRYENQRGGEMICLPDQSVFTNAMLGTGDNLLFTLNTIDWLKQGGRTNCLLYIGGTEAAPADPAALQLYVPPPSASETARALKKLWNSTNTRAKIELANEALEFAQEEGMIEELVASVSVDDLISRNRFWAILIFLAAWSVIIFFVVALISPRKRPLESSTIDGLKNDERKEKKRRNSLERMRAAESLILHFANRIGMQGGDVQDLDADRLFVLNAPGETRRLRKQLLQFQGDLTRQPQSFWTDRRLSEVSRSIADWSVLYETGDLRVDASSVETTEVLVPRS